MPSPLITPEDIATYQRDGVVLIRGLFADHVDTLRKGVARNMESPGPYASENKTANPAASSTTTATGSAFPSSKR